MCGRRIEMDGSSPRTNMLCRLPTVVSWLKSGVLFLVIHIVTPVFVVFILASESVYCFEELPWQSLSFPSEPFIYFHLIFIPFYRASDWLL